MMPRKEIVSTDKVLAGNAPLSQATKLGNMVFVAGNTGRHPTTGAVGDGIKEQTRFALERISAILEAAGSSIDHVLTNTCYVSNRDDLAGFNEVYAEFFTKDLPARTTVVVNFGDPNNLVEVTSTAYIPG
ncbi:MAG: reactive intermediate/imine deaminase [Chloroflexi bacterium]|nr:reactive intermediate/imine deaminase [Chloroflexota bacterium]|tara:strand:+ start:6062 stop:6451 length:390 start_codon:yes stop_codon:yes gene_type:complete